MLCYNKLLGFKFIHLFSGCKTKDGKNCEFPFTYLGVTYISGCPVDPIDPKETWCSTKTDSNGNHVNGVGSYGFCMDDCPKFDNIGSKGEFFKHNSKNILCR